MHNIRSEANPYRSLEPVLICSLYDTYRPFSRTFIIKTFEQFQMATPILNVGNFENVQNFDFMLVGTLNLCFRGNRIDW